MITSALFTIFTFSLLSVFTFFIAKESPKGSYKRWEYTSLPGVLTPNVLKSKETWIVAHEAMSPYFTLLAIYFSLAGVFNVVLIFMGNEKVEIILTVSFLLGIVAFSIIVFAGDRIVSKQEG
ncbi:SdpI family protein [Corynebacterium ulcerans]|uniref:SdpI family protein n=1 Tax=Corynebacterium ulcerans TaxID=65058 RepID=A0ABD7MUM6_CORUL|nr:hypothetical protein [Corynebacterium ulcerans]AEG80614.1 putative membrane protein [Corynebacterium ulcerans 809]QQU26477.1 hypothetical protein I6I75_03980 [Corynebacterium ulcerans]SNV10356.1 Uncharacterised protein [Corynebacterium ulcerans]SQG52512.1 Uncharacterised protein [Corynebacterium ulcerans]SQH02962.1 Uncharacterised protein [Corynebacterium ulcerans]